MKPAKAQCPHRHPWFVECFDCANEVIFERLGVGKVTVESGPSWRKETHIGYYDPKIFFPGSSAVERTPVKCVVAGSIPAWGAGSPYEHDSNSPPLEIVRVETPAGPQPVVVDPTLGPREFKLVKGGSPIRVETPFFLDQPPPTPVSATIVPFVPGSPESRIEILAETHTVIDFESLRRSRQEMIDSATRGPIAFFELPDMTPEDIHKLKASIEKRLEAPPFGGPSK